jgi:GAF domain
MSMLATSAPARDATTFIRATEIWLPSADGRHLEFGSGLYGPLRDFEAVSRATRFAIGEGLPGRAWAAGHPIVLKDLVHSYFKRGAEAQAAGLTCGLAVPIFAGPVLTAVLVLFCGDDRAHVGAVEVWNAPAGESELGLVDGYFGTANVFEWSARHTKFPKGAGLPGLVWETGMPLILEDLGRARRFLRWETAQRVGINRGVGIPCGEGWVLTFLSALNSPIARRVEVWVPNSEGLVFAAGYCEESRDLAARRQGQIIGAGIGTLGKVWQSGVPAISTDLEAEPVVAVSDDLATMVAMPVHDAGAVRAVVAWYL